MIRAALGACLLAGLTTACATGGSATFDGPVLRPATDTPAAFEFPNAAAGVTGCSSPAVDPRTSAEFRFVRSSAEIGDYAVPEGLYGVRRGERLRIDCRTGVALGIVR